MKPNEHVRCLILGSGPAGYTAALYASRADLKPVLYQGGQPGGQLTITSHVENFPGYPDGALGPDMMMDMQKQAARFGADIRTGLATSVDFSSYPLLVTIDENHIISACSVIVATGASAKWLGIESEKRLNGSGVSACAVCDGYFFRGQDVAIVGGGDTAAEEATYLAKLCRKVYMLVRKDYLRASKAMQNRVMTTKNLEVLFNHEVKEITGENAVSGARVFNNKTGAETTLDIQGFFVAIGHSPNTEIFKNWLDMDETGYVKVKPGSTKTNIEGVFVAGDAADKNYRQAVTAAGTGCMAALDAERFLSDKGMH